MRADSPNILTVCKIEIFLSLFRSLEPSASHGSSAIMPPYLEPTRQHCRLSICEYWLSLTNTVSVEDQKIPITTLILKQGPCLEPTCSNVVFKSTIWKFFVNFISMVICIWINSNQLRSSVHYNLFHLAFDTTILRQTNDGHKCANRTWHHNFRTKIWLVICTKWQK